MWALLSAFAALSAAAGFGVLYGPDSLLLRASQYWANETLDRISSLFSTLGGIEASVFAFGVLVAWLFFTSRRLLAVRLVVVLLIASLVEVAMKFWLPQPRMPEDAARVTDFSPMVDVQYAYPYPSGHMLRSVIVLGTIYVLWRNKVSRALIVVALVGMALSRVYLGVHWASDVIGGALLGLAGLTWAFGYRKKGKLWR